MNNDPEDWMTDSDAGFHHDGQNEDDTGLVERIARGYPREKSYLQRSVAIMLQSLSIPCSASALQMTTMLAEEYMLHLATHLHKYTVMQRRSTPSIRDVAFMFTAEGIHTGDLEEEYFRSQFVFLPPDPLTDTTIQPDSDTEFLRICEDWDKQQGLLSHIARSSRKKAEIAYIPSWMPPLPADYTYRSTPVFVQRVTNPRDIRERILEEGRVVEEALRKLGSLSSGAAAITGDNNNSSTTAEIAAVEGMNIELNLESSDEESSNLILKQQERRPNPKRFDIVALAAARKKRTINPIILHIGKKAKT
ncbi:transcription factor TFIID complex subunit 8 C-term-domain-containing protein [Limtongia smithiae]|uniref:transcription factor TFIID complex subunit 8 C-term-domain-containing protein n=1 Tax=Limtongia smithiae TaxID=1125753 RepID=UPI0034CDC34E